MIWNCFDIIVAHWLLAGVCFQLSFFFSSFSESTVLDGRFCRWQGTPWRGDSPYATCTLLNAKERKGLWDVFLLVQVSKRSLHVCVCICVFVFVCLWMHKRYVWNRVEDICPLSLKSFSLILLKPATVMWLFASSDNIYTVCFLAHVIF